MTAYERIIQALEAHGCARRGNDHVCPSHPDKDPSLSVTEGTAGVVMHCHAGCSNEQVVASLGLVMADLFNEPVKKEKREIVATYDYNDAQGNLLFQVVRFSPKDFRQRRPDPSKKDGWNWSVAGVPKVLYRLPTLRHAIRHDETIYLCEGEKDVEALEGHGLRATCNPGGAGKWKDEYTEQLRGAYVVQVVDRDDAGFKHARLVRDALAGVVANHEFVGAKEGKDAYDHFAKGYNVDEFVPIVIDDNPDVGVFEGAEEPPASNPMWAKLLSTNAIDDMPSPEYAIEDLVTTDAITVIYGLPGSTKSFLALDMALSIANNRPMFGKKVQGGDVLYVVAEGMATFRDRKKAWQIEHDVPDPDGVTWYPEPVNLLDENDVAHLLEIVDALQPVAIVFDTLSECMPGADENAPAPMTMAIQNLNRLRRATKAAIIVVHHTRKDGNSPRGHSALMGVMWGGIKITMEADGDIKLEVEKMRHDEKVSFTMRLRKVDVPGSKKGSAVLYLPIQVADSDDALFGDIELLNLIEEVSGPEGMASAKLLELSGMAERTFHKRRNRLLMTGRITNVGTSRQPRWASSRLLG